MGFRFRRKSNKLFGKPDISVKKYKVAIFIDSCFWHQCPLHSNKPKSNIDYWENKLNRNQERDKEVNEFYLKKGWKVIRVWEHEVKNDLEKVVLELAEFIKEAQEGKKETKFYLFSMGLISQNKII
ncbi:very short patch repair endonuclease [Bacillus sp. 179-C3.3 HS]|uniref:very short patch repair endonuclease n=1 Tax=Bacillus sp. 179-C3.3 HS TaxID=3232162 RepID=UPI00399F97F4